MRTLFAASLTLLLFLAGCATISNTTALTRFEFRRMEMGVPFRMVFYDTSPEHATNAAEAAFIRLKQLNDILTDYDATSELSLLARTSGSGQKVKVSDDLWRMLVESRRAYDLSDGAFDITVGPQVLLWRKARREHSLPAPEKLREVSKSVGFNHITLFPSEQAARLDAPDMRLDVGGIAKGYAADEAIKVLKLHGIRSALVGAAGDLAVSEPPPGKPGWKIEIANLRTNDPVRFVLLKNEGISTSGDNYQYVEIGGVRYSHVVNPKTGLGLTNHTLTTVIAPNATATDALDTGFGILGGPRGFKMIHPLKGVAARYVEETPTGITEEMDDDFRRHLAQ